MKEIRNKIFLSLLIAAILSPTISLAAPSISEVSGTVSDNASLTISGSGFGIKIPAAPLLWDTFENGTLGNTIQNVSAEIGNWETGVGSDNVFYSDSAVYAGIRSARHPFTSVDYNSSLAKNATSYPVLYVDFQRYYDGTNGSVSNYKPWRLYGNDDNLQIFKGYGCGYQVQQIYEVGGVSNTNWAGVGVQPDQWTHYQIIYKESTPGMPDGTMIALVNGVADGHNSTNIMTRQQDVHINQIRIGHYFDVANRDGCDPSDSSVVYTDNVYIDTTWSRVELGNASTYAASTHREIQVPTSWDSSGNRIDFSLNQGTFQSGETAYLYVTDSTGAVNQSGYPVAIDSSGTGDTTAPATPAGLRVQ